MNQNTQHQKKAEEGTLRGFLIAIAMIFIMLSLSMYLYFWYHPVENTIVSLVLEIPMAVLFVTAISVAFFLALFLFQDREVIDFKWSWIYLLALPFFIFSLIGALSPVTDSDGAGYHLAMPKYYLEQGGFAYHPNVISNWPMSAEMVYAIMLRTGLPPKFLPFMFGILLALLSYVITKKYFGESAAKWAALLTYTMPMVVLESGIAYVDLFFAFFIVLGLYLIYEYSEKHSNADLLLGSLILGFGASIKWTGPLFVVIAFMYIIMKDVFADRKLSWKHLLFPLPGILFFGLWLTKNWILSGNPLMPFLVGKNWFDANVQSYLLTVHQAGMDLSSIFINFFKLNFRGMDFGELTWFGPIFFAFIPLLIFRKKIPKQTWTVLKFAGLFYVIWYFTSPQSRLLLPILVLLISIVAWVIKDSKVCKAAAVIAIIMALPFAVLYNGQVLFHNDLLLEKIPSYVIYDKLNSFPPIKMHSGDVIANWETVNDTSFTKKPFVLVYGDIHTYYLDTDYIWARPDMQGYITRYSDLKNYGITYVVINTNDNEFPEIKRAIYKNNLTFLDNYAGVELWQVN